MVFGRVNEVQLTHGSLFTGYGGLDMAVEQVFGAKTVWVSDIDKGANKIIEHRFPGVQNLWDITKVDWVEVPKVDIISGGSPCQDVSHAGKRAGMTEGTRSNLWVSMREAIEVLKPRFVVWENVRGVLSAKADSEVESCQGCLGDGAGKPSLRALGRVLGDLASLGYDAEWRGLRASDVGAPHQRFRVFIVAYPKCGQSCRSTSGQTSSGSSSSEFARCNGTSLKLLPTPTVIDMGSNKTVDESEAWTAEQSAKHKNGNGHGASLSIEALKLLPTPLAQDSAGAMTTQDRAANGYGPALRDVEYLLPNHKSIDWGDFGAAIERWETIIDRAAPAPTVPDGRNGRHRLSPRFVEWMMGLPAGWVSDVPEITRNEQLKALGNGVVPQQAAAALIDCLKEISPKE